MSSYDSIISDIEAPAGNHTREDVYRLVDERISEAKAAIHRLKCFRNRHAPVCKLPAELLSLILCMALEDRTGQAHVYGSDREFFPANWSEHVELTMTCKRWRDVALECPLFWQNIPFCRSARYPDMLARSKGCPLELRLNQSYSQRDRDSHSNISVQDPDDSDDELQPMPLPATIVSQLADPRLGELHLKVKPIQLRSLVVHFPSSGFLGVTRINISSTEPADPWMDWSIPSHIFAASSMPSLRHLMLTRCRILWDELPGLGALSTNLITLHIIDPSRNIPSSVFYNILASNPCLKDFVLTGKSLLNVSGKPRNPIPLTALWKYTIWVEAPLFEQFYASITWPKAKPTKLTLTCTNQHTLTRFIDAFRQSRLATAFTHVRMDNDLRRVAFSNPQVEFTLKLRMNGLSDLLPLLYFPALESLSIVTPYMFRISDLEDAGEEPTVPPTDSWIDFFHKHQAIQNLHLGGHTQEHVFAALGGNATVPPPLPSLLHLTLAYPYLCADQPSTIQDGFTSVFADAAYPPFCTFYDSLLIRYGSENYLEKLKIDTENFVHGKKVMGLVEEVVGVDGVEWNHEPQDGGSDIFE